MPQLKANLHGVRLCLVGTRPHPRPQCVRRTAFKQNLVLRVGDATCAQIDFTRIFSPAHHRQRNQATALLRRRQLNGCVKPAVREKVFNVAALFGGFQRRIRHNAEHRALQTLRAERDHASKD